MSSIVEKARNAAISVTLNQALKYLEKNPEANIPKVMDLVDKAAPEGWYEAQRSAFRNAIAEKNNWYQLMMKVWELDPGVRNAFFKNFIVNASLSGSALQEEIMEKEDINVPWAILLDPTSACNLHCTGCWAAEYGNRLNLSLEELDSIVTQGKAMGTYMYIFTGGEPLVFPLWRLNQYTRRKAACAISSIRFFCVPIAGIPPRAGTGGRSSHAGCGGSPRQPPPPERRNPSPCGGSSPQSGSCPDRV